MRFSDQAGHRQTDSQPGLFRGHKRFENLFRLADPRSIVDHLHDHLHAPFQLEQLAPIRETRFILHLRLSISHLKVKQVW
jgi:hypothetical protein